MKSVKKVDSLQKVTFPRPMKSRKYLREKSEFQKHLDAYLTEAAEELEDYSLNFPKHGIFWDDGYQDVRQGP